MFENKFKPVNLEIQVQLKTTLVFLNDLN